MPDDLGQFPTPTNPTPDTSTPVYPPIATTQTPEITPTPPSAFEETPEEIPAYSPPAPVEAPPPAVVELAPPPENASSYPPYEATPPEVQPNPVAAQPAPVQPVLVSATPSAGINMGPIIFIVLFLVAAVALAGAAFLYQQTNSLKGQLGDITKTLQKQQTNPEVTPTPSVVEIPNTSPTPTSPIITPVSTISATPSLTPTPTPVTYVPGSPLKPLSIAPKILQIAINHQPNAQFILMKTESANDPVNATTKYFFRQDLKTKKYFYVLISGTNEPEIVDKQIYVTPDDNIPSLNDLVLRNDLGVDLDEVINMVYAACPDKTLCSAGVAKAQYIKTASAVIWQITLNVANKTTPMVMQIDAQTKTVIFKTPDFTK